MSTAARDIPDQRRRLFRVHFWVRLVLWAHAALLDLTRPGTARLTVAAPVVVIVMLVWTSATSWSYVRRRPRRAVVVAADLLVTVALVLISRPLLPADQLGWLGSSLVAYWIVGAPLAAAIAGGAVPGLMSALALALVAFGLHPSPNPEAWGGIVLLTLVGGGLGWLVSQMEETIRERDESLRRAAALSERERLNRAVHDGVLQVLAMVERDGNALGPRGQTLARLARDSEIQLRSLLQCKTLDESRVADSADPEHANLTELLDRHESGSVTISAMADDVVLDAARAAEIDAVVAEALRNVVKHAGPDAHAWVLVEAEGNTLQISVRDDGVGADPKQILGAYEHGRLGVRESVIGRVRDLGGETELRAAKGRGVEWEFTIPMQTS